ncbi:molybdopterin biosynthesis protein [Salisediminibacterium beveridgei]|uniref:Molybdopterin molybdenumtransferase n=1 Tax=Salisediminibacterium beveridgei TaxID=632773 RepID=A0A1D7QSV5_9BACI|nr:molybdopterin biosynthesis protein [Salisediminibacterium beveridgei]AOM82095.1 Molybdopterin biosynthesis protein MoeA / Periplasmic molybdate-binding domain [Salisediminibacterium beveridgei]
MKKRHERTIYLEDKPRHEALQECLTFIDQQKKTTEVLPVAEAMGRVTATPIFAGVSNPHYHASAMDGIAVEANRTQTAHESRPLHLKNGADFAYVDTGHAIPSPFNAVIMIEQVNEAGDDVLEIIEPAVPWQHIRPIGEDITYGEMLLPQGHQIRPVDAGALLGAQVLDVEVKQKPKVAIYPSGNELIQPDQKAEPGKLIEFNGTIFSGMVESWGGIPMLKPIVRDDREKIRQALIEGTTEADIVLINAGSSAGSRDYTKDVIEELGEVWTHGIATRPGKPVIIGNVNDTIVMGVPGYPVSAYFVMEWFVEPMIHAWNGQPTPVKPVMNVIAGRRMTSNMGSEDFVRVHIGKVGDQYIANPLSRSASVTMSLVKADGIVTIPPEHLGVEQGDLVEARLLKPKEQLDLTTLFSGSHDLSIDILSSVMKESDGVSSITPSHTGSLAGLIALQRGEAHIAGIHLLDPATGEYNDSYIRKWLKDLDIIKLPFLRRSQGLIVPAGNPEHIEGIEDVTREGIHYINRQKGAGTRVLFDHLLKKHEISPDQLEGYRREMYTHLSVAAEVMVDHHSCGMGIYSAAKAVGADFIPVGDEQYDLIMTKTFYESERGQKLYQALRSEEFKHKVESLGGYSVNENVEPVAIEN